MISLVRFWFKFARLAHPSPLNFGCGVTAYGHADAVEIIKATVFAGRTIPHVTDVIGNIDVTKLDQGHVIPNMAPSHIRGVWFPLGYETQESSL